MRFQALIISILLSVVAVGQKWEKDSLTLVADTSLAKSTFYVPGEDFFTPRFHSINSGYLNFDYDQDLTDYSWVSKSFMPMYKTLNLAQDTSPEFLARYDYGMATAHWFGADFYRPIGKSDIGLQFNRNYSDLLYSNTEVENMNIVLGANVNISPKYTFGFNYFRNESNRDENGGVKDFEDFKNASQLTSFNVDLNLTSAKTEFFNHGFNITQNLLLGTAKDSVGKEKSRWELDIDLRGEETRMTFQMNKTDIDSMYFSQILIDSNETFDSIGFKFLSIAPKLSWKKGDQTISAGYNKFIYNHDFLSRSNLFFNASNRVNSLDIELGGKLDLESYWKYNYAIDLFLKYKWKNILIQYENRAAYEVPEYIFLNYSGNHFNWVNDFKPVQSYYGKGRVSFEKYKTAIEIGAVAAFDYVYLDADGVAKQAGDSVIVRKYSVKVDNVVGNNWVKLYSAVGGIWSDLELIQVPSFYTRNTLEFNFKIREVPFSVGSMFTYSTQYIGRGYNPILRHYQVGTQNVGGFPLLDAFFVARVGTADLYVRYENALYEALDRDIMVGSGYPISKPFLRFGLKWKLKN